MTYPAIVKTGAMKEVFLKVKTTGTPEKFTAQHLKSLGYTSSNDVAILKALKIVGFINTDSKPTEKYKSYKGKDGPKILAEGIKTGYSELYQLYPDAEQKDEESLAHFFATKTDAGESTRKTMIATFKALCSMADFKSEKSYSESVDTPPAAEKLKEVITSKNNLNPAVNINIELQIPATNDPEVYKNFFEAMKKHLLNN